MEQDNKQPAATDTATPTARELKYEVVEKPGGLFQTYTNHVLVNWTIHDVRIRFGELSRLPELRPSDEPTLKLEERASIAMAWSEAKVLRDLLADIIARFEKLNGEISQPKLP